MKLYEEVEMTGKCPDCGHTEFIDGPEGGGSINICCEKCQSAFCVSIGNFMLRISNRAFRMYFKDKFVEKSMKQKVSVYGGPFGEYLGEFYVTDRTTRQIRSKSDLIIHPAWKCQDHFCPFHKPSNNHMIDWPMNVRLDKSSLVERVCPHGVGHPDPDSVAFLGQNDKYIGIHGCCHLNCCSPRERIEL